MSGGPPCSLQQFSSAWPESPLQGSQAWLVLADRQPLLLQPPRANSICVFCQAVRSHTNSIILLNLTRCWTVSGTAHREMSTNSIITLLLLDSTIPCVFRSSHTHTRWDWFQTGTEGPSAAVTLSWDPLQRSDKYRICDKVGLDHSQYIDLVVSLCILSSHFSLTSLFYGEPSEKEKSPSESSPSDSETKDMVSF